VRRAGVPRENVAVRLVTHHATERIAFSAFKALGGVGPLSPPPFLARVSVDGERLPDEVVRDYFMAPHPLPSGRATHQLTAAATAATVGALLSPTRRKLHVPAPAGRPGGYPVTVSRAGVELDLPDGLSEMDAIAINAVAARWDGIELIAPDGTLTFTAAVSDEIERTLGLRVRHITLDEQQTVADELAARLSR
jgi:hypothetical protein